MIRRPPRSTHCISSAASDVYKRQNKAGRELRDTLILIIMNCNICLEEYEGEVRVPKILPCGHTYCLPCITAMHAKALALACPICQKPLHDTQPALLNTNYALITSVESQPLNVRNQRRDRASTKGLVCAVHNEEFICVCECMELQCMACANQRHLEHEKRMVTEGERTTIELMRGSALKKLFGFSESVFKRAEILAANVPNIVYQLKVANMEARKNDEVWIRAMEGETGRELESLKEEMMKEYAKGLGCFEVLNGKLAALRVSAKRLKEFEPDGINPGGAITADSLERNIGRYFEMQRMVSLLRKCKRAKACLDNYLKLVHKPITASDIEAYRRRILQSIKQKLYIRMNDGPGNPIAVSPYETGKGFVSCSEPVHVGWDELSAFCLQGLVLYRYCFASSLWETVALRLCIDSIEYKYLTELTLVGNNKNYLYIVGGFNRQTKEHVASCFCICHGRICRIASLNRPKSLVTAIHLQNHIYVLGGKINRQHFFSDTDACTDIEYYNVFVNTWTLLPVQLGFPRYSATVCESGLGFLIVGGYEKAYNFCFALELVSVNEGSLKVENLKKVLEVPYEVSRFGVAVDDSLCLICEIAGSVDMHDKKGDYHIAKFSVDGQYKGTKTIGRISTGINKIMPVHKGLFYNFVVEPAENGANRLKPIVYNTKGELENRLEINGGVIESLLTNTCN
eukprot:TRINITY_DN6492_c0_g1_i8.p1 TRINITY_DN6492_c0_g1~~TRINITY_DN6492_c0_g1_i8.p1  ORF type:complete len:704 (-),score=150.52 TRINITY_DN6492_c0_g1_i8:125-2182(-)